MLVINSQIKKGVLDLCVLAKIYHKDYYGYQLVSEIVKHIDIAEGTLYPILRKMNVDEYLTSYLQESPDGPARKYYSITDKGRQYLFAQIDEWNQFYNSVNTIIGEIKQEGEKDE